MKFANVNEGNCAEDRNGEQKDDEEEAEVDALEVRDALLVDEILRERD